MNKRRTKDIMKLMMSDFDVVMGECVCVCVCVCKCVSV
jgi:hypothetical protein